MQAYLPQLPQSEKPTTSTLPNFLPKLPSPPQSRQTQVRFLSNAKEFTAKRRSVSDKTSKSFLPNAKEFQIKRKDVFQSYFSSKIPHKT